MPSFSLPALLLLASAAIIFALGTLHLWITFRGTKLHPRDAALMQQMQTVPLRITRETTMWKAWVGFNASHSSAGMLFGLVYGYFAVSASAMFFRSLFLEGVGLTFLLGLVFLGKRYWFRVPFTGILIATIAYVAAILASLSPWHG
jgi:hypothetical protein